MHIEYYAWLFRTFDRLIQKHAKRLGREPEIYLISHFLLARIVNESKTPEERQKWLAMVDEKQGRKVPLIIVEDKEPAYVEMFGGERIASLGGRGGSCTNAMRRIASVNNNWCPGGMGGDLAHERASQKRIHDAGGFGAMGYIFEWTNTEVFAYLAAQHLWRNAGIPGVSNTDQTGILEYAYQLYYGDEVGTLVARAMDEGSCVNDSMVLEGVNGSQYPFTGPILHRDHQFLAVLADHAEALARQAYQTLHGKRAGPVRRRLRSGRISRGTVTTPRRTSSSRPSGFASSGFPPRRSQEMCGVALAHRLAQRLIAEARAGGRCSEASRPGDRVRQGQSAASTSSTTTTITTRRTASAQKSRKSWKRNAPRSPAPAGEAAKKFAEAPVLMIPWEKQVDIVPAGDAKADIYLRTGIGFTTNEDYFRLGVVFTVQIQHDGQEWKTLFRKSIHRRSQGWHVCKIPVSELSQAKTLRVRFMTDSYTRAMHANMPMWKWALWRQPQLVRGDRREVSSTISPSG